jgi:DNA-directed RNA polymerase subunit M/transcription elongation factor TFIIS
MKFCARCGAIMKMKGKLFVCGCGTWDAPDKATVIETMPKKQELKVLMSEINPLAVFDHKCSKCGFDKAQIASKGVQYTDEDEEVEFICGRCGSHEQADGLKIK